MEKTTNKTLIEQASSAKTAINALRALQSKYMRGEVSYDTMKELGTNYINIYNKYAKAFAKSKGMPFKPISLGYFLR